MISVGEGNDTEVYESAAAFLFTVFSKCDRVGQKEAKTLRQMFGPFPASEATKACSIVHTIMSWVPEDDHHLLLPQSKSQDDSGNLLLDTA